MKKAIYDIFEMNMPRREIVKICTQKISLHPEEVNSYIVRGLAYEYLGEYKNALKDYNKAVELDPNNGFVHILQGTILTMVGEYDKAIEKLSMVLEKMAPNDMSAYLHRGIAYRNKGDYTKAIEDFSKAIDLEKKDYFIYRQRGIAYTDVGEYGKAIADMERAQVLKSDNPTIIGSIGEILFRQGKLEEALKQINKVFVMKDDDTYTPYAYLTKILICLETGDKKALEETVNSAVKYLGMKIKEKPEDAIAFSVLAEIYCEINRNINEAITLITKSGSLRHDYQTDYVLGYCYFRKGDYKLAEEYFKKSLAANPRYVWCIYRLGLVYKAVGDFEKAKETFQKALQIDPNYRFTLKEIENL